MRQEAVRAKYNIIIATIELLKTKPYDKISIKEICENARVSRQTFYAHYTSKDDVFRNFYIEMFNDLCLNKISNISYFYSDEFVISIINFYDQWSELFIVLNRWNLLSILTKDSINIINDLILEICDVPYINDYPSYFLSFIYEPLTSVCLKWVLNNKKESKEELFNIISYYRKINSYFLSI